MKNVALIYDDKCSLCRGSMKWIELHAIRKGIFEFVSCQSEERRLRFPWLAEERCMQSLQLIFPDGHTLAGDEVIPEIISRLRGYRILSVLFKLPVIKSVLFALYRKLADNRYIISQFIKPLIPE
ncbi:MULTISPECIES: thiol-disulfide oxidoreductase DCC family protein [Candidatus Kuenenia]|jgi:predicted DCC family thiol-disulfide oxidoreductase YuxK|uniref:DUF393 domain-containing protein n=1 Tax=Kuenenia stuttgartiensis TaxID=174633 RepID=A0A2C9CEE3_KUEST|nr:MULTISPECIES: DUF393 domain-containing protein [Kuenenia]MCZ7623969.1 DUF393 domain-containing protein [Candidatus Kuenenia sp.]SOH04070.1 hypothetical protein KSMBR1_1571 [Candidatus Kuenenia stuttgartiensis]